MKKIKKVKGWISKDGDKIENMSFFGTKKSAVGFQRMTGIDIIVPCTILYSLPLTPKKK